MGACFEEMLCLLHRSWRGMYVCVWRFGALLRASDPTFRHARAVTARAATRRVICSPGLHRRSVGTHEVEHEFYFVRALLQVLLDLIRLKEKDKARVPP
jgi:hypothetical protein